MRSKLTATLLLVGCSLPPELPAEAKPEANLEVAKATGKEIVGAVANPSKDGCITDPAELDLFCIEALPEGVASCAECDAKCIEEAIFRCPGSGPHIEAVSCDIHPIESGEGCCFAVKIGHLWWDCTP